MSRVPPMLCFCAPSGTGKTTLLEGVVRALTERGVRVGVVKSDAHRLQLDTPGKDSWRLRQAGAGAALVVGREAMGLFGEVRGAQSLVGLVDRYLLDYDIVLAEGFRRSGLPAIRVSRAAAPEDPDWDPPQNVVAWAADAPVYTNLPVLPLGDPAAVADWVAAQYLGAAPTRRNVTLVVPVADEAVLAEHAAAIRALADAHGARVLVVLARAPTGPVPLPWVMDLRPGLGPLGALLTGLAAAETPDVLFVGPRHLGARPATVEGLLRAGGRAADVVVPTRGLYRQPLFALYGHRCLGAIQAALLSGEPRMDAWWGQVRTVLVDEPQWRAWDPDDGARLGA